MHKAVWRRGERQGLRADGTMFELCRRRVIAAFFHFEAYNEGSPRALCVYFKDPMEVLHCHHTGTCAAAFSVRVSAVCPFARKGESADLFALGFRKGNDPGTVDGLAPHARREEFVGAGTDVFL